MTKAFDVLSATVAKGMGFDILERHVFPHPLNPLPEEKVRAIAREHLPDVVKQLLQATGRS